MRDWGELQLELASATGLEFHLISAALNSAYSDILNQRDWSGKFTEWVTEVPGISTAGTVQVTAGSTTVTFTGSAIEAAWISRRIRIATRDEYYSFSLVDVGTATAQLDRPYQGATGATEKFEVWAPYVTMPNDFRGLRYPDWSVTNISQNFQMAAADASWLNAWDSRRVQRGAPTRYAVAPDSSDAAPPVERRIELWPAPKDDTTIKVEYERALVGFDGSNTADYPASWVSDTAIIELAKAKLSKDPQQVKMANEAFAFALSAMHREESRRRPAARLVTTGDYQRSAGRTGADSWFRPTPIR